MAQFHILHASDLHMALFPYKASMPSLTIPALSWLGKVAFWRQASHDPNVVAAFGELAERYYPITDVLLVTGDLATTGEPHDLQAAYTCYPAAPANNLVHVTAAGDPTLYRWASAGKLDLLPGNHDRFHPAYKGYRPGNGEFENVFCPSTGQQFWPKGQTVARGFAVQRGPWELHVIKADFSLPASHHGKSFYWLPGWLGQGTVDPTVLGLLKQETEDARAEIASRGSIPITLWAIHFDPTSTDEVLKLLDSEDLCQAAWELCVPLILCGHTHESKIKPLSDRTVAFVCGTSGQAGPGHKDCQIIGVDADDYGAKPPVFHVAWFRYGAGQFHFIGMR